jgi:hypothetical protein
MHEKRGPNLACAQGAASAGREVMFRAPLFFCNFSFEEAKEKLEGSHNTTKQMSNVSNSDLHYKEKKQEITTTEPMHSNLNEILRSRNQPHSRRSE